MKDTKPAPGESIQTDEILREVAGLVAGLEEGAGALQVTFERRRPASRLVGMSLGREAAAPTFLVKIPTARPRVLSDDGAPRRPRIVEPVPQEGKAGLEATSLEHLEAYLGEGADPRIGVLHVAGRIEAWSALVLEHRNAPSLRRLALDPHSHLRRAGRVRLLAAFEHTGAWLKALHSAPAPPHTRNRHLGRADWVDLAGSVADYLAAHATVRPPPCLPSRAARLLEGELGAKPPVGVAHGDFTMRNVLVEGDLPRIYGLDTLLRWRTCTYEDVGYFLADLATGIPQGVLSPLPGVGRAVDRARRAFMEGYFGEDAMAEEASVRAFELVATLDRWAAVVERRRGPTGAAREAVYRRHVAQLLAEGGYR